MAKKLDIKNPLFNTLEETKEEQQAAEPKKVGRPRKDDIIRGNSAQEGLTEDLIRATFILKVSALNDLKDYAYTKRITIKDALTEMIETFIKNYKENPHNDELLHHKK